MKKGLIAGATGYLGQYVVKAFKKQGYWVRALARNADKLESLKVCLGKGAQQNELHGSRTSAAKRD